MATSTVLAKPHVTGWEMATSTVVSKTLCYRVGDGYQYSCQQNLMLQGGRWLPVQLLAKYYVQNEVSRKPRKSLFIGKTEPKTNLYKENLKLCNKTNKCTSA